MPDRARARFVAELGLEVIEAVHERPHFPPHAHATYALGVVERGVNRFRYRGAWHSAPAGAICTVTPGEVHTVEAAGGTGFAYRCMYPPPALLAEVAAGLSESAVVGTPVLPPVVEDRAAARRLVELLAALGTGAPRLETETRLGAILAHILMHHAVRGVQPARTSLPDRALARVRDLLAARITENVTLRELAAEAGLNRFSLLRRFARAYGLPPHAWVIQERVRRAQDLLRTGRAPAEVAAAVGFADQSHLTRHFRRLIGVTPGCYRAARRGS